MWDGFSSLFMFLANRDPGNLATTEKAWLKALGNKEMRG